MAILEVVKSVGQAIVGAVSANPVVAAGVLAGTAVVGYGGYRLNQNRKAKKANLVTASIAPLPSVVALLENMTFRDAKAAGLKAEWLAHHDAEVVTKTA